MSKYLAAIDQGTSGTRCIIFDKKGRIISSSYIKHRQITPHPGWVEQDPLEIIRNVKFVLKDAIRKSKVKEKDIVLGVTNQRETIVGWDKNSGKPVYNAIVWQDSRTYKTIEYLRDNGFDDEIWKKTGLHPSTYFSATKIKWLIDNTDRIKDKLSRGDILFGNMDTWIIWNLTNEHKFITDTTNASRTMLMNLKKLDWDDDILEIFNIPRDSLPLISKSIRFDDEIKFDDIEVHSEIGDQQASLLGSLGFDVGDLEVTYGTGSFLLQNIGVKPRLNRKGLITTCAYSIGKSCVYAYEGSNAISGQLLAWLHDNINLISSFDEAEEILKKNLNKDRSVYFVPAFSGLFAPYWDQSARGMIIGLTENTKKDDILLSVFDAMCYQIRDIVELMGPRDINKIIVGGGPTENSSLMQLQANILGIKIIKSRIKEMTAFGAAIAAGLGAGEFNSIDELKRINIADKEFLPSSDKNKWNANYRNWLKAIEKSRGWIGLGNN